MAAIEREESRAMAAMCLWVRLCLRRGRAKDKAEDTAVYFPYIMIFSNKAVVVILGSSSGTDHSQEEMALSLLLSCLLRGGRLIAVAHLKGSCIVLVESPGTSVVLVELKP